MIRKEDIRAFDKDRASVAESFRVGDIVRGVVVSLGDAGGGGYYVSTARDELGVVMGRESRKELEEGGTRGRGKGEWMWAGSWRDMVRSDGGGEGRKVGRPI